MGEDFYLQSFNYILKQLAELKANTLNWHPTGVLQLAYKERDHKRWLKLSRRIQQDPSLAATFQCLNKEEASRVANIPIHYPALFFPKAGWIEPKSLCDALLLHKNIKVLKQTEVIYLQQTEINECSNWLLKDSSQQTITQSEVVVICTGKDLDFPEITSLPSIPISGQTTLAKGGEISQQLRTVIDHKGYITPLISKSPTPQLVNKNHQQVLFGASYVLNNTDTRYHDKANQENLQKQKEYIPELAQELHQLEHGHAAIRIVTPDRLPYVGAVPKLDQYQQDYTDLHYGKYWQEYANASYHQGLFISTAYGSRGLTTTGLCADILVSLINNDISPVSENLIQALHPARFYIRELKSHIAK